MVSSCLHVVLVAATLLTEAASVAVTKKPHIFVILADDFGWHNIGWRNPEIVSPNLDGLAAQGIKLDRHCELAAACPAQPAYLPVS